MARGPELTSSSWVVCGSLGNAAALRWVPILLEQFPGKAAFGTIHVFLLCGACKIHQNKNQSNMKVTLERACLHFTPLLP